MSEFIKAAQIGLDQTTDDDMAKINQYSLETLKAEDVFTFKVMAGDDGLDDRNHEPFSAKALLDMASLYKGKPMIWEHGRGVKGTEQIARVYDAKIEQTDLPEGKGERTQLILHAYMLNSDSNSDLIKEIKAGIKKEVSTNVYPSSLICSVCGQDQMKSYCRHWPGRTYDGKQCLMTIDGVKDVLELSFVGTPAQPRAGAVKSYNPALKDAREEDFKELKAPNVEAMEKEIYLLAEMAEGDADE